MLKKRKNIGVETHGGWSIDYQVKVDGLVCMYDFIRQGLEWEISCGR